MSRRVFLQAAAAAPCLALLSGRHTSGLSSSDKGSVIVAKNGTPAELVAGALEPLGGMGGFVSEGDRVLVKPNASFGVAPNTGANTAPEVASAVAILALEAGASRVVLTDHPISKPGSITVQMNGLKQAAEGCGGEFQVLQSSSDFESLGVAGGEVLRTVDAAKIYRESDVLINLPVLKQHDATGASVGLKNLMGLVYDRALFHREGLDTCIAELSLAIRPDLTIVDATRVLVTNGPRGPGQVIEMGRVVAGVDPVAVDVASLGLASDLGYQDFSIGTRNAYITVADRLAVGDGNPSSVEAKTLEVDVQGTSGPRVVDGARDAMPDWVPYVSLSAASIALGLGATILDRRKTRSVQTDKG